ncbi:MAG: pilus assembly protein [Clostridiales bacterium]|nr:pilus assembly protein [Candidatus Blautia equi]
MRVSGNEIRTWRKQFRKGSSVIEAAAVMPIIFFAIFACLYLCFYVHNRAWLTAAAYESALVGSMEEAKRDGDPYSAANMRSRELGSTGFFGVENLTTVTVVTKNRVQVTYDMDTMGSYAGMRGHLGVAGESKIIQPVKRIRQIKAASEAFEMFKE